MTVKGYVCYKIEKTKEKGIALSKNKRGLL